MKIPSLLLILSLGTFGTAFSQVPPPAPAPALDFGDNVSYKLTSKAWLASEAKDYPTALGYAGRVIETYKTQAIEQQKALTAAPTEKEEVFKQWALNDVGTCYFIQGQVLEKQGKTKEAVASYKFLVDNLAFAQCWDPKGWFWEPAAASAGRTKALEFDAL